MLNLKQKLDGHNKSTLQKTNVVPPKAFNCRQLAHCPLDGNCLKSAVIYQAIVATEDNRPAETYVGLTENSFETRYSNHKSSFRDPNKRLSTELSKHIWHLKDAKIGFSLTWKVLCKPRLLIPLQIAVICACGKNILSLAEPIWPLPAGTRVNSFLAALHLLLARNNF